MSYFILYYEFLCQFNLMYLNTRRSLNPEILQFLVNQASLENIRLH